MTSGLAVGTALRESTSHARLRTSGTAFWESWEDGGTLFSREGVLPAFGPVEESPTTRVNVRVDRDSRAAFRANLAWESASADDRDGPGGSLAPSTLRTA